MSGPLPPADPLFMDVGGRTTLAASLDDTPRTAIVHGLCRQMDAGLKALLGKRAWCTVNGSFDPEKVPPEQTPLVLLWEGQELGPDTEPLQPLDRCLLEMKPYIWVKGKRDNAEVQRALNRAVWAIKKILEGVTECGGYQVEILRRGSAIQTWAADTEGEAMCVFWLSYDLPLY